MGADETQGWVGIGGRRIANSYIVEWSNSKVSFRVPHNMNTGIISVHTQNGDATGALVINSDQVPQKERVLDFQNGRSLRSISTKSAYPGAQIVIQGGGFGVGSGGTLYLGDYLLGQNEILSWDSDRIEFFVPVVQSGAISFGSDPVSKLSPTVEVMPQGARFDLSQPVRYSIDLEYDVADINLIQGGQGVIQLYFPDPSTSSSQKVTKIEARGDFVENATSNEGQRIFRRQLSGSDLKLSEVLNYEILAWNLKITVDPTNLPPKGDQNIYERFTQASPLVPFGQGELAKLAKTLKGDEASHYLISQKIISWVKGNIRNNNTNTFILAPEVLRDKSGSMIGISSLHVALMRLSGVPARLVEGYLVLNENKLVQRIWCEYFISGIGWIPYDPLTNSINEPNVLSFDNQHLGFIIEEQNRTLTRISESSVKNYQKLQFMEVHAESLGHVDSFGFTIHDPILRLVQNGATGR